MSDTATVNASMQVGMQQRADELAELERQHPEIFDKDTNREEDGRWTVLAERHNRLRVNKPEEKADEPPKQEQTSKPADSGYESSGTYELFPGALQESILATMIYMNDDNARAVVNNLDLRWFANPYDEIARPVLEYWRNYDRAPNSHIDELLSEVLNFPEHKKYSTYQGVIKRMFSLLRNGLNSEFVLKNLSEFGLRQKLKLALFIVGTPLGQHHKIGDHLANEFEKTFAGVFEWRRQFDNKEPDCLSVDDWLKLELPEPKRLLGDLICDDSRLWIVGPKGIGKTLFHMFQGMCISSGRDCLHWTGPGTPKVVLYIDGEMDPTRLQMRLRQLVYESRQEWKEQAENVLLGRFSGVPQFGNFFLLSQLLQMGKKRPIPPLNTVEGQRYIDSVIDQIQQKTGLPVNAVYADNINSLFERDDSFFAKSWAQYVQYMYSLTERRIAQIYLHHTGADKSKGYGSDTLTWHMDTVGIMKGDPKDDHLLFELDFSEKHRHRTEDNRSDFQTTTISYTKNNGWETSTIRPLIGSEPKPPSDRAKQFYDRLVEEIDKNGVLTDGRKVGSSKAWKAYLYEKALLAKSDNRSQQNSQHAIFSNMRTELVLANRIECDGDAVWLTNRKV